MPWMIHTGCRYHNQDTNVSCGAAAAMMILNEIGVPYSQLDQDDLYDDNHDHNALNTNWASDPYGLAWTLNNRRPSGTNGFVVRKPLTEAEGSQKIVYTLHKYKVSPAALIQGCQHWIVVPGVETDVEPLSGVNYTIQGFWIHNPHWHAGDPPPPHDGTDTCGTGGGNGDSNEFVTYADWQNMFTGCNYDDSLGRDQFISVCDPEEPKIELPRRVSPEYLADGRRILTQEEVLKFSQEGLKKYKLMENKRVSAAVEDAEPGTPHLVLRLDQPNKYYYLVPWKTKEGISATSRVDGRFGNFLGIHLTEKPSKQTRYLSRKSIINRITDRRFELRKLRGRIRIFPEAATISSTLVWRPCQESYNPNLPFYQVSIGDYSIYVRVDGEIFTDLTYLGPKGD